MTTTPAIYVYRPSDDGPSKIRWARPYVNSYGMTLLPSRLVKVDYVEPDDPNERKTASEKPDHILEADKPFRCVEGGDLHTFVKSCQLFRRLASSEFQVAGDGSVLLADNPEAPRIPVPPAPDREPLSEEEIRGPSNASWAALEEVSSRELMRTASHNGKRAGKER
jgi:hypothetical protein